MSLQTPAKGVQWWRWCDLRWQTVPDLGTSNRKGSVANGGLVGLLAERRARRLVKSATRTNGPRYDNAQPWRTLYVSTATLNCMRCGMGSQCRLISASDTWSERRKPKISTALRNGYWECMNCGRRTGAVYLSVVSVEMWWQAMPLNQRDEVNSVQDEQERPQHRPLRYTIHEVGGGRPWRATTHVLGPTRQIRPEPHVSNVSDAESLPTNVEAVPHGQPYQTRLIGLALLHIYIGVLLV